MFPKTTVDKGIGPLTAADSVEIFEVLVVFEEDGDRDGDADVLVCLLL